jgi:hypothetical protein
MILICTTGAPRLELWNVNGAGARLLTRSVLSADVR